VLKCQATDKPKALILRRGPHRPWWPMDPVSRLIQLCYNPLPTRPPAHPSAPRSLSSDTLGAPISRRVALSGVAEAEHAFVSNPVYDRGHTAPALAPQSSCSARLLRSRRVRSSATLELTSLFPSIGGNLSERKSREASLWKKWNLEGTIAES